MSADAVSLFMEQWRRERPDLPLAAMETLGRFGRVMALATRRIEATLGGHGLRVAEFDVLASLRRLGPPYVATPSQLTRTLMLSPAGMTSRLDKLEAGGLIERRPDPADRRSLLVVLTDAGLASVDAAVADHVATEEAILAALTDAQRHALDDALTTLLAALETEPAVTRR